MPRPKREHNSTSRSWRKAAASSRGGRKTLTANCVNAEEDLSKGGCWSTRSILVGRASNSAHAMTSCGFRGCRGQREPH